MTGRERVERARTRLSALLARHEHRPIVDVGQRLYRRDREVAGTIVGSAIALRLFLFFVPLLLFVVGLAGFVGRWVDVDDVTESAGVSGTMAEQIQAAFAQQGGAQWVAALVGLFGMATTGRTLSKVMATASALAWRLPQRDRPSLRIIGALVGLVAGLALLATLVNRVRQEFGVGLTGVSFVIVFGVYVAVWLVIGHLLPRATSDPGSLVPGAVLVAATLTGMQAISQLYLPDRLGRASELYGALGTTIVTLGWFFILGRAIVISMCLNAVVDERFGSISGFVFSLPVLRVVPRRSAWTRRHFGLDAVDESIGPPRESGGGDDKTSS